MDKREMERLMDKYKAEMLEFSRRNNTTNYPKQDEREKEMSEAIEENNTFERDRSDPLPKEEEEVSNEINVEAVPAQTQPMQTENTAAVNTSPDVAQSLRRSCERLPSDASSEQKQRCRYINDFLAENRESGSLKVETYAADRSFGIGSARVMVFIELPGGNVAVFDGITDNDGTTESIILPAPPRELSQSPQTGSNPRLPYSTYSVYVEHPDFVRSVFTNVPVFSGVESIQPVRMLAKVDGVDEPEPIVVNEGSNFALINRGER